MSVLSGGRPLTGSLAEAAARHAAAAEDSTSPADRRPTALERAAMSDVQQSQMGLATTLGCVVVGTIVQNYGPYFVALCMASGAVLSGVSTLLSSLSSLKTQEQARRHAEERHRAEMARHFGRPAEGGSGSD